MSYVALKMAEHNEDDERPPNYDEKYLANNTEVDENEKSKLQTTLQKFNKISSIQNSAYVSTISNHFGKAVLFHIAETNDININ